MELRKYLPSGWKFSITSGGPLIMAPTQHDVELWLDRVSGFLVESANNLQGSIQIGWEGCRRPYRFTPALASVEGGEKFQQLSSETESETVKTDEPLQNNSIIEVPELEIISEVLGFDGSSALLRMSDDLGLLSNTRTEVSSGLKANDWMKVKDHSHWWPDDELRNYKRRLLGDGQLNNYSYYARMITTGKLSLYTVTTRLVVYRGDLCRLVKTHSVVAVED